MSGLDSIILIGSPPRHGKYFWTDSLAAIVFARRFWIELGLFSRLPMGGDVYFAILLINSADLLCSLSSLRIL